MIPPVETTDRSRSTQRALGVVLVLTLFLLAFRGYGNGFTTRPTERVAPSRTDLNHADRAQLEQVPGIGPTLAKEIEEHRKKKGPFQSIEELRQVKGVGPATFAKVQPYLLVEPTPVIARESTELEPLVLERKPPSPASPTPPRAPAASTKKLQAGDPPIDVNVAGIDELTRLPGIGPVTAQHIITARTEQPFRTLADLDHVKGIGPKTLEKLRPFVTLK